MPPAAVPTVHTLADLAGLAATDLVLVAGTAEPVMAYLAERVLPPPPPANPKPAPPGRRT
jgi:hypothetical protein